MCQPGIPARSFAELHRDLWRVFWGSPYVYFSLSGGMLFLLTHLQNLMALTTGAEDLTVRLFRIPFRFLTAMIMAVVTKVALSAHREGETESLRGGTAGKGNARFGVHVMALISAGGFVFARLFLEM